jgi:hypothetical protein
MRFYEPFPRMHLQHRKQTTMPKTVSSGAGVTSIAVLSLLLTAVCATDLNDHTTLVSFDGSTGTTYEWADTNDPVMGGLSTSNFTGGCMILAVTLFIRTSS